MDIHVHPKLQFTIDSNILFNSKLKERQTYKLQININVLIYQFSIKNTKEIILNFLLRRRAIFFIWHGALLVKPREQINFLLISFIWICLLWGGFIGLIALIVRSSTQRLHRKEVDILRYSIHNRTRLNESECITDVYTCRFNALHTLTNFSCLSINM